MKMSELVVNSKEGINQIKEIQFGVLSSSDIGKISVMECINYELYYNYENSSPIPYSPIDPHLGVNQKEKVCPTCNKKIKNCPGHFGYVRLSLPIFHIGFFKNIIEILRCICKNCSRILLPVEKKNKIRLRALKIKKLSENKSKAILKDIINLCDKVKICPYCGALNGKVKHVKGISGTIIVHEINKENLEKLKKKNNEDKSFTRKYESAIILFSQKNKFKLNSSNREMNIESLNNIYNNSSSSTITTELTSPLVYNLFSHISPEDIIFFGMDEENSSPINLLIQYVIVPPLSIRPTVTMGLNGTNEDDLTIQIREIIGLNTSLKSYIVEGNGNTFKLLDDLNLLQSFHAFYINSDTKGINKNFVNNKEIRSLCTRLKGKKGRFRGNLCGKRVDYSGRTVISPDPNLQIDQLGIPVFMAMKLTYPEKVNEYNIKKLKKYIMNGPDKHPGANFVFTDNGENIISLGFNREKTCRELKIGDIVERHLMDGDIVLFNRQPSLHRVSIMAFKAKVLPWRTLRFNESNCVPYNADFDGDEMNIHFPQTEEAKSEAYNLMSVTRNLQSPKLGEPLIASIQDFLITCYFITQKDYFLDRTHFMRYCTYFNDGTEKVDIPPPTILKPKELWTGKQLFSIILKPNKSYKNIVINLKKKLKIFSNLYEVDKFRCPKEGYVLIRNSELLCGIINKDTLGKDKDGLIFALIRDCGVTEAAKFLTRISKFSSRWICDYGLLGIEDVTPSRDLIIQKKEEISKNFEESEKEINLYNTGRIKLIPGLNAEKSLESKLIKILSDIRENLGAYLIEKLPRSNTAFQMVVSGSKGSNSNISHMIGCVGQQTIDGNRVPYGFLNRSLPHFEEFSKYPESKGFIGHSFYDGMNAIEFFFHTMGGRIGLVDTAIKTADSGYMQRRLIKPLEDLTVQYNNTITISNGEIIQFLYGGDGIEPLSADSKDKIVYLPRLWDLICSKYPLRETKDKALEINEIQEKVDEYLSKCPISEHERSEKFINEIRQFFLEKINTIEDTKKSLLNPQSNIINKICSIGDNQLKEFFNELWTRYIKARVNPGEPVGSIAAQSIGEPGTQMTLKTFHFAGVASKNITLGLPRIEEILNNTKNISTPLITAKLINNKDITLAKIVKGRIEKIKLSRICKYIKEVISPNSCYIKVKIDLDYIKSSYLEISIQKVKAALLKKQKLSLKLGEKNIIIKNESKLIIYPPENNMNNLYFNLEILMKNLPEIIVSGISTVNHIEINKSEKDEYDLSVEGVGLFDIMNTNGIDYKHCKSNNIEEIYSSLGIEAARKSIIYQLNYTFEQHSTEVDRKHLGLISDLMTFKGAVFGFTRSGIIKMKEGVFLNASFEKTTDILLDAGLYGKVENLRGVSESIIVGKMAPIGTGTFKLFMDKKMFNEHIKERKNGMMIEEENTNENDDEKDFAKNKVQFNLVDMIS